MGGLYAYGGGYPYGYCGGYPYYYGYNNCGYGYGWGGGMVTPARSLERDLCSI